MNDRSWFRYALGLIVVLGGMAGFGALIMFSVPSTNRDAVMLALGVILGWGSSVVAYEFGSTSSGRALAQQNGEIVKNNAAGPSGRPADPVIIVEQPK